jgi:hypothetical protein
MARSARALLALLAAGVAFVVLVPTLWADAAGQSEIQKFLNGGTILTASAAQLAGAVASAIADTANTNSPADLAASALEPYEGRVRADRNTLAPLIAVSAINALISGTDANLNSDAGAVTDSLVVVNTAAPLATDEALSAAGRTAVVKAALAAISDAAVSNSSLLGTDQGIGQALASDTYLEHLPKDALTAILQRGMAGINGAKGKAQTVAPQAAENFVQGLISFEMPNGASYPAFAVSILKEVSKNASVDELVAYQIALADNSSQASLLTLAGALFEKYPSATAKVTQGITAVTPPGVDDETQRIAFIQALTAAQVSKAVSVVEGAVFVDPYYAGQFTDAVFKSVIVSPKGEKLLGRDASSIAKGLGAVLGQDGSVLTQVADVFSQYIGSGKLPAASAASYAADLIKAATTGSIPASQFSGAAAGGGGGQLNIGAGISTATVTDLVSILDLLGNGIITADHAQLGTAAGLSKAVSEMRALATAVAKFTGNELFINSNNVSQPVAAFLAGTLADQVVQLTTAGYAQSAILNAISEAVTRVTNSVVDKEVTAAISERADYPVIGAISSQETAVTNL